jgi:hypothetical protein
LKTLVSHTPHTQRHTHHHGVIAAPKLQDCSATESTQYYLSTAWHCSLSSSQGIICHHVCCGDSCHDPTQTSLRTQSAKSPVRAGPSLTHCIPQHSLLAWLNTTSQHAADPHAHKNHLHHHCHPTRSSLHKDAACAVTRAVTCAQHVPNSIRACRAALIAGAADACCCRPHAQCHMPLR